MNKKIYIGIDPGKKGGIAVEYRDKLLVNPYSKKEFLETMDYTKKYFKTNEVFIFLEDIHGSVGKSRNTRTIITQMEDFGYIQGVINMAGYSFYFIPIKDWKKYYNIPVTKAEWMEYQGHKASNKEIKDMSITVATSRFPEVNFKRTERCTTLDDGMCEAVLIMNYGKNVIAPQIKNGEESSGR